MDPINLEDVINWKRPTNVLEILTGYYRRFVEGFSHIASALARLTQKRVKFVWADDYVRTFEELNHHL